MPLDKRALLEQLQRTYAQRLTNAHRAELDAREAARTVATESEKKEDGRVALEFGSLANGQAQRVRAARAELEQLQALASRPAPVYGDGAKVGLLAVIDVELQPEEGPTEERTFLMLPLGAGTALTGPGGDGFLSVITPASPVGKALMGKKAGDSMEVQLGKGVCELTILDVG